MSVAGNFDMMTFLAGAGLPGLLEQITKLMPKQQAQQKNPAAPSVQLPHRPGMRIGAGGPPGSATVAPSMMRTLMQQAQPGAGGPPPGGMPPGPMPPPGGPPPGGMPPIDPQMLLQMLAARGG